MSEPHTDPYLDSCFEDTQYCFCCGRPFGQEVKQAEPEVCSDCSAGGVAEGETEVEIE